MEAQSRLRLLLAGLASLTLSGLVGSAWQVRVRGFIAVLSDWQGGKLIGDFDAFGTFSQLELLLVDLLRHAAVSFGLTELGS